MVSQSHQRVIDTATRLYAQRGYSAVSMRDLAKALGIQAPSIYSFVDSKETLIRQCVTPYIEAIKELVDAANAQPEGLSPLVLSLFKIFESHHEAMIVVHREPVCYGDAGQVDDWLAGALLRYDINTYLAWPALAALRDPWMRPGEPTEDKLVNLHLLMLKLSEI